MVTPFGGAKTPFIIDLTPRTKADSLDANPTAISVASTITSSIYANNCCDFSKISGTFYFAVTYTHDALVNAGTTNIHLRDYTNGVTLATATAQTTADIDAVGASRFSSSTEVAFVLFTKPTNTAIVGLRILNADNTGGTKNFRLYNAAIWVL